MKRFLLLLPLLFVPATCFGQSVDHRSGEAVTLNNIGLVYSDLGWGNLKQLAPGQETKVVLNDATSYQGKLQSVSDDVLVIHTGNGNQTFTRQSVARVSIKRRGHRGRNALIGAALGAGAGLGVGAAIDHCGSKPAPCFGNKGKAIATPLFALIGAGIGALISRGGWQEVYPSP
jgi:hypothetical protein